MTNYDAVVFDLDGTLVDSRLDMTASINRILRQEGYQERALEEIVLFLGKGQLEAVRNACPPGTDESVLHRLSDAFLDDYAANCCVNTYAYEGAAELIAYLKAHGLKTGIITNKPEYIAEKVVSNFFDIQSFDIVRGAQDSSPLKPDPAAGHAICRDLALPAESIIYIGDGGSDMSFAKSVGFFALGAVWGYRDKAELIAYGADETIETPAEFLTKIRFDSGPETRQPKIDL